jgi:uncharacterized protein (DUF1778 family)
MKDPLDQTVFPLNEEDWNKLQKALNAPPKANKALKAVFKKKPLWEQNK